MKIDFLNIDLETYSDADLSTCGVYRYVESSSFEILLFGYAINGGKVSVVDLARGETLPAEVIHALLDPSIIKYAFNASFERICLSRWLASHYPHLFNGYGSAEDTTASYLDPVSWKCTMIWCAYLGLPLSLANVGKVLELDDQKMTEGKNLLRYFCMPCKPTKANGNRTRNLPEHAPEKWELFLKYNRRDVEVEMTIQHRLKNYPVPDFVWEEYHLDQQINDRGVLIDPVFIKNAIQMDERSRSDLLEQMKALTHLENPNSVSQLKAWLAQRGVSLPSLGKKDVRAYLPSASGDVKKVLELRLQTSKSSVKKYQAMERAVCKDGRARGMFQFYGANRSGRWAGRLVQLQNLPRNKMDDLAEVRELVRGGAYETLKSLHPNIPDVLSQLIRTALIARPGYHFVVSDFSAIEARVLAYLAHEDWRLAAFSRDEDIYCASASRIYGVPVVKHGINSELRDKGKIAELALGYGGSVGAMISMGALDGGLTERELPDLVQAWRSSNPHIVQLWEDVDRAVKRTVRYGVRSEVNGIFFFYRNQMLFIRLPSQRFLCYAKPRIEYSEKGYEEITYEGIDSQKKWSRIRSYGAKFVENIVQAISRDLLAYAMKQLSDQFICAHVHDELIIECKENISSAGICEKMNEAPPWMPDIPLQADGGETKFYRKV